MSLKDFCTFWRTPDILLISCQINLIITGSQSCVCTDMATQASVSEYGESRARPTMG